MDSSRAPAGLNARARAPGFVAALVGLVAFTIALWVLWLTQLDRVRSPVGAAGRGEVACYLLMLAGGLGCALGVLTLPFSLSRRRWVGRTARAAAHFMAAVLLLAAYVDAHLYALLGIHLHDSVVTTLLGRGSVNESLHIGWAESLGAALAVVTAMAGLTLLAWLGGRLAKSSPTSLRRIPVLLALLTALPAIGWAGSRQLHSSSSRAGRALPLHGLLFAAPAAPGGDAWLLHYPKVEGPVPRLQRRPSYLLVLVETLRGDMLTPESMPRLWAFQSDPRCSASSNHVASSHSTDHCLFSLLYGLDSYHYQILGKRNVPSYPLRVLKENGYQVVGGSSAPLIHWGELSYLTEQFHRFYEAKGDNPAERDADLLRWATDFLANQDKDTPFFLFVFFDATHHKYYYPPEFELNRPVLAESHSLIRGDEADPAVRLGFVNRYKNSVRFVDQTAATLLQRFEESRGNNDWIAAMTGDHGEEFRDHGLLGHASVSFVNSRIRVPLVLCTSNGAPPSLALSSHVDVLPTFLDYAGLPPAVAAADYSSGQSLFAASDPNRWVSVFAIEFPRKNRALALVSRTAKLLVEKQTSGAREFQVVGATDAADVPEKQPAERIESGLGSLGRSYRAFSDLPHDSLRSAKARLRGNVASETDMDLPGRARRDGRLFSVRSRAWNRGGAPRVAAR